MAHAICIYGWGPVHSSGLVFFEAEVEADIKEIFAAADAYESGDMDGNEAEAARRWAVNKKFIPDD